MWCVCVCVCVCVCGDQTLPSQGVVGTEHSLKSALVTAFSDGELDLEGDEQGGALVAKLELSVPSPPQMAGQRRS